MRDIYYLMFMSTIFAFSLGFFLSEAIRRCALKEAGLNSIQVQQFTLFTLNMPSGWVLWIGFCLIISAWVVRA